MLPFRVGKVNPTGFPEFITVTLDGQASSGCVDNGHHLRDVFTDKAEEKSFIGVVKIVEKNIFLQIIRLQGELTVGSLELFIQSLHRMG